VPIAKLVELSSVIDIESLIVLCCREDDNGVPHRLCTDTSGVGKGSIHIFWSLLHGVVAVAAVGDLGSNGRVGVDESL